MSLAVAPEIPVVDLSRVLNGEPDDAADAALVSALADIGFFVLVGHGVDWSAVEAAFAQTRRFFDLPQDRKMEIRVGTGGADSYELAAKQRGYIAYRGLPASTPTDIDERDKNGVESLSLDDDRNGINQWPRDLPGFREAILAYRAELDRLAFRLLPAYARVLGLAPDYFESRFQRGSGGLRLSHYPAAQSDEDAYDRWGIMPHTDRSFFTILPANDVPGLEIRPEGMPWISAPFVPQSFVVNSGDMLRRWTNDRMLSTPHRVTKPRAERYAMPFFFSPRPDAVLTPLATCVSQARPALYPEITAREFFAEFMRRDYHNDDPRLAS